MPVGEAVKGRLFNVVGEAIDGIGAVDTGKTYPIHREAPKFEDLTTSTEVLFTGIKVIDLIEPYAKGGKIGLFGGAGVGKTVLIQERSTTSPRATAATRCSPVWVSAPAKGTTCSGETIESGIVKYGDDFNHSMEEGGWDLSRWTRQS